MRAHTRFRRHLLVCLLIAPAAASANWEDGAVAVGVPVALGPGTQALALAATPDGQGGAIVVFERRLSSTNRDIYAQRISALGVALWNPNGVPVCVVTGLQTAPVPASDGAGGVILAWTDRRDSTSHVYAQQVDASGVAMWAANGVPIGSSTHGQVAPAIASDGAGGVIIAFQDTYNFAADIRAQRVSPSGSALWAPSGVRLSPVNGPQFQPLLCSDGAGGAFACWFDMRTSPDTTVIDTDDFEFGDIYAQRVNASGLLQWMPTTGVPICALPDQQLARQIVADDSGAMMVAWTAWNTSNIFVQRMSAMGSAQWAVNGVTVAAAPPSFFDLPQLVPDDAGGAIVTWEMQHVPTGSYHVFAQRIGAPGTPLWGANGLDVYTGSNGLGFPKIARDGTGGAIITWSHSDFGSTDVAAQRIDGAGIRIWGNAGTLVCGLAGSSQSLPVIVEDPSGRGIVFWQDNRNGGGDVYGYTAPATRVVTTTSNSGAGSLRQVIQDQTGISMPFAVNFDLAGIGPHDILLSSPLPTVTVPAIIDGYSQAGSSRNTSPPGEPSNAWVPIVIGQAFAPTFVGLVLAGGHSVVRGVAVNGFLHGISLFSNDNVVEGCFVGLHPTGVVPQGNFYYGIAVSGDRNRIGGVEPSQRNMISGNGYGVQVGASQSAFDNVVIGNWIGTDVSGENAVGNFYLGVGIDGSDNVVGGSSAAESNVIAHSAEVGVHVFSGTGNRISGNSIYSNGQLGIDLQPVGVTANDVGDGDSGPNQRINFPVLAAAASTPGSTTINGTCDGAAGVTLEIQFFASPACDGTGNGEGKSYLGSASVGTGPGNAPFSVVLPVAVEPGSWVTATAIDAAGNTSEFSSCIPLANTPSGGNVTVELSQGSFTASLNFENVTAPGNTTLEVAAGCPGLPGSFIIPSAICYNLTTTASFTGNVDVCFSYDDTLIPGDEANVRLVHYDTTTMPPDWVDITTGVDTAANTVCGETTSLSPFAVGVGSITPVDPGPSLPTEFALHQNVPNPFNPATTIAYDVPLGGDVTIEIYDVAGRRVRTLVDKWQAAGRYSAHWSGENSVGERVASGIYFCRMHAGAFSAVRKMVLLK